MLLHYIASPKGVQCRLQDDGYNISDGDYSFLKPGGHVNHQKV